MEGSVRQSGENLRVTVQLNDAENGFHIWSRTYDHKNNDNVLDTQIAIGNEVTSLFSSDRPASTTYQKRKHPSSAEAYKLFLIAQSHMKFIEVSHLEIALEMDPLSSVTNFAVGDVLGNLGQFDLAISHYLQCQELLPDNYSCFLGLANIYKLTGDFDKFYDYLNLAAQRVEADNFWLTITNALLELWDFSFGASHILNLAYCYQDLNRQKEAQVLLQKYHYFIQSLPAVVKTIPGVIYNEARYLVLAGKPDEADALLQKIQDWPFIWLYDSDPVWQAFNIPVSTVPVNDA